MITRSSAAIIFLPLAAFVIALFLVTPSQAQNVQVDLTSTCSGASCFNVAGLFTTGTQFLGTNGMDDGTNCTPPAPYTNCPDAYSSNQLGLSTATPPTLTPPSLNVPFTFGTVNTTNCGPSNCTVDIVNYTAAGVVVTPPAAEQMVYSTMVILGTAVNGSHLGNITATYTDNTTNVFSQTLSDWCSFSGGTAGGAGGGAQTESIAVGGIERISANGVLDSSASCNLYAYTLPLDYTRNLRSITLTDGDGSGDSYALAITLKPPSYIIAAAAPSSTTVKVGSSVTSIATVTPQPGYVGSVQLSCSISPDISTSSVEMAPTCGLNPTSVTLTAGESSPPTTTLTFTAANATQAMAKHGNIFYAFWLVPGLAVTALGFGSRSSRRKTLLGLSLLGLLLAAVLATPGCLTYTHFGNVGTPTGRYYISITGVDQKGLTQASNPTGTSNTVAVTVTD